MNTRNFNKQIKDATDNTIASNASYYKKLDFADEREAEFATKGLIAAPKSLELWNEEGTKVLWSLDAFAFVKDYDKSPDSVNPSLWRNTKHNLEYGLFEVCKGIYQVRGYDFSNITFVETDNGWIVLDPLVSIECVKASMNLVNENLGVRPVKAIIFSHTHLDHYGGVKGLIDESDAADPSLSFEDQMASGKIPIIVPEGFLEHAVSENVFAVSAMGRRAGCQYGVYIDPGISGKLSMGIGMGQSLGTTSFIKPTYEVKTNREILVIDGIEMECQLTPGTEAPVEMHHYFPKYKALWLAENCTASLHNLYTFRGAQIRDGNVWAKAITDAWVFYGHKTEVIFQSHNWPRWGNDYIKIYMENTAAVYKYINDQTLTYLNMGYQSEEISYMIKLPEALEKNWYTRPYYGTVSHNAKGIYQKYMGWYDANPVNLHKLPPSESAKKLVEYMGDTDAVLKKAKADFDAGKYQWVAEITNVIVFAEPDNLDARYLCADAMEQLGYQAESGTWRSLYLTGASELRNGTDYDESRIATYGPEIRMNMTGQMMIDFISVLLDREKIEDMDCRVNLILTDTKESYTLRIFGGVILSYENLLDPNPNLTITTIKNALFYLMKNNREGVKNTMKLEGDISILYKLMDNMINFFDTFFFNTIEPKK